MSKLEAEYQNRQRLASAQESKTPIEIGGVWACVEEERKHLENNALMVGSHLVQDTEPDGKEVDLFTTQWSLQGRIENDCVGQDKKSVMLSCLLVRSADLPKWNILHS